MSFINDNTPLAINHRNWNCVMVSPDVTFSGVCAVFGSGAPSCTFLSQYGNIPIPPYRVVDPLVIAKRDLHLTYTNFIGTATFEELALNTFFGTPTVANLNGLSGYTASFEMTLPVGATTAISSSSVTAGRLNTTPGGSKWFEFGYENAAASILRITPSANVFTSFGFYLIDYGDFASLTDSYIVYVHGTSGSVYSLDFSIPAGSNSNGQTAFIGGLLTQDSISYIEFAFSNNFNSADIMGLDDVYFGCYNGR
jgi:hypothetical protein